MFTSPYPLVLSPTERTELEAMTRSRVLAAGLAHRARVILAIADGESYAILFDLTGEIVWRRRRWTCATIVWRATANVADTGAHAIAGNSMVGNPDENVARIAEIVIQSQSHLLHPRLARHFTYEFNFQAVMTMSGILCVCGDRS